MQSFSLLFQQNTSIQVNYQKKKVTFPTTDLELYKAMHRSLYNKYAYSQNYHYLKDIHFILIKKDCPYIRYKDQHQYDDPEKKVTLIQYMSAYYGLKQAKQALKTFTAVYKYHQVIPRFFFRNVSFDLMIDKYFNKKRKIQFKKALKMIENEKQEISKPKHQFQINLKKISQKTIIQNRLNTFKPILDDLKQSKPTTLIMYELIQTDNLSNLPLLSDLERSHLSSFIVAQTNIIGFEEYLRKMNFFSKSSNQTSYRQSIQDFNVAPKKQIRQIKIAQTSQNKIQPFGLPTPRKLAPRTPMGLNKVRASEPQIDVKVKEMLRLYRSQKNLFKDSTNCNPPKGDKIIKSTKPTTKFNIRLKENIPTRKI